VIVFVFKQNSCTMLFGLSLFIKAINWFFASADTSTANGQQPKKSSSSFVKVGATATAVAAGYFLYRKYHKPAPKKAKEPIRVVITGAAGQIVRSVLQQGHQNAFDQSLIICVLSTH
jgi:multisubunit Na+/H+ antiporter MnhC subunit